MSFLKWFYPGMGIKRWLFLALIGIAAMANGFILFVNLDLSNYTTQIFAWSIQAGIPIRFLFVSLISGGFALLAFGIWGLMRSILTAVNPGSRHSLVDIVYHQRNLNRGMKIVVIGGGTGLSTLLRGLKEFTGNITAVVTVSDDGGSSGRLRKELGVLPPGDIRNCLVALADSEILGDLLQHRFEEGEELSGHSFGNLFLVAMTGITGDFLRAVKASSRVLAIRGKVLPSTLESITLCAELEDGTIVDGESSVSQKGRLIQRLFPRPPRPQPLEEVIDAIKEADGIVLGPGSLFTSIMPNLLITKMADTIRNSSAVKIFVCNCMTQPGETDSFSASMHLDAFQKQFGPGIIQYALVNTARPRPKLANRYREKGQEFVEPDTAGIEKMGIRPVPLPLLSEAEVVRHDPRKLSEAIMKVVMEALYGAPREPIQAEENLPLTAP